MTGLTVIVLSVTGTFPLGESDSQWDGGYEAGPFRKHVLKQKKVQR